MEGTIIILILMALWGYWSFRIAEKNGRSKGLAIFMGLLFGLGAVIVYYIIGATQSVKLKRAEELVEMNKRITFLNEESRLRNRTENPKNS